MPARNSRGSLIKFDVLRVNCEKCGWDGCMGLSRLINQRGGMGQRNWQVAL